MILSRKKRGCDYERKLVHLLNGMGYASVRVAGSGCVRYPSPDIVASNSERLIAFEVKSTRKDRVYLSDKTFNGLLEFARVFGAEPWFAVHFVSKGWFFKKADELLNKNVKKVDKNNMKRMF